MTTQLPKALPAYEEVDFATNSGAETLPILVWLTRAQWVVVTLTLVVVFRYFILPWATPMPHVWLVDMAILLLLLGAAGLLSWMLYRIGRFARQELLLREAFHGVLTPQIITNATGAAALSNRAFEGWIDIAGQNAEASIVSRFADPAGSSESLQRLSAAARSGQVAVAELPVFRNKRIVEWRRVTIRQLAGWPNYLQWRFEDISERRYMERAMREEQAKLVDFMTNAPVGIYSVDQHGRFRFVNRAMAEWLGCGAEELVHNGVRLHEVLVNPLKDVPPYAFLRSDDPQQAGEVSLRNRDGESFPVAITQTVVMADDGQTLRTRSIVRDLRPERKWQLALDVSEQRFERLFAEAPIGVALLDNGLKIIECNAALQRMLRRPSTAIVNNDFAELLRDEDRGSTIARLKQALTANENMRPMEVHLLGERHIIAMIYIKQFAAVGKTITEGGERQSGLVLYFIDITEQKSMEFQFAQSQKMQAIGQLAGGIAHDFNNLLTAMIGFCDLLLQRHKPGDQSFADIMQVKQNGSRAANLVKQLLAFSRQQTLQPQLLNMVDILADLTNLLQRLIGSNVTMTMHHGRDLPPVLADKNQIEQVVINLVVNARDAMQSGGKVSIRSANHHQHHVVVRGQDEMPIGDYVSIEVVDSGSGIPPEIMQRIFEPFFSTKEIGQGTGLGLSTVYGIVRQTGGFIEVESKLGAGTRFMVYLPAHKIERALKLIDPDEAREKSTADLTGAGTILLVEDEDAVRVFSSRALRNKGYLVLEARHGEEALTIMAREGKKIDLLISDVVMPQMDGPTMMTKIREQWPDLKVIFISGYTEDKFRSQLKAGEIVHFLGKPFTLKQLAAKVKDVLAMTDDAA
jgi:two-component system, cell cycle sensor histidine kinase and response regulator CckA